MPEKYYIDTSIWMDLYEDRKGHCDEPLGDYAWKLLSMIKAKGNVLVISDLLLRELEGFYSLAEVNGMMKLFEHVIEKVVAIPAQRMEAKNIAQERNIPPGDCLHAILARDHQLILITRDNDFRKLGEMAKYYKPEEII